VRPSGAAVELGAGLVIGLAYGGAVFGAAVDQPLLAASSGVIGAVLTVLVALVVRQS
jgi:uncharacterized membrane protein